MKPHAVQQPRETTLLEQADVARLEISGMLEPAQRSALGQFMTPSPVAGFMASRFTAIPSAVHLLDAGAGFGALTAAFVHEMCKRRRRPKRITVTAYEIDGALIPVLKRTLARCEEEAKIAGITLTSEVRDEDFILAAAHPMLGGRTTYQQYDCAILNPPYAKIQSKSPERLALRTLGIETSNLYSAFLAITIRQLRAGGQLVAITPRSFCNGPYFMPFRELLLSETRLRQIHIYESRAKAFSDDAVLQENIIIHAVKTKRRTGVVTISSSTGPDDCHAQVHRVPYSDVVVPHDPNGFIRVIESKEQHALATDLRKLPTTLGQLGMAVSTGRVVDFRAKEFLRDYPSGDTRPLIYSAHFKDGFVAWPRADARKPNALTYCDDTASLFVPQGTYVLTKRFSSKEERRRIVAAVYDSRRVTADVVGFENHLNYFHAKGNGLPDLFARGLMLFLNSTVVDCYFRQFSGHTQVNATDLRTLHYPTRQQLEELGRHLGDVIPEQSHIDELVEQIIMSPKDRVAQSTSDNGAASTAADSRP